MKNRGRRKAHPIWNYFDDHRDNGRIVTKCLHCEFTTPARTHPVMKSHFRVCHNKGNPSLYFQMMQESARYKRKNKDDSPTHENVMETSSENIESPTALKRKHSLQMEAEPEATTSKGPLQCTKFMKTETQRDSSTPESNITETAGPTSVATISIKSELVVEPSASPCLLLPENLLNVFQEAVAGRKNTQFSLSSGISDLLEVAKEYKLKFIFDTRGVSEYCLSKDDASVMLVIVDCGNEISVKVKNGSNVIEEVQWIKADWNQFLWAIRGKCAKIFDVVVID